MFLRLKWASLSRLTEFFLLTINRTRQEKKLSLIKWFFSQTASFFMFLLEEKKKREAEIRAAETVICITNPIFSQFARI